MDMRHLVHGMRDLLDDLAETLARASDTDVEAVVSITSKGAGLPRTRAYFDNLKVPIDAAGQARVRTPRGSHRLTWDVQGPQNADIRILVEVDGIRVADEGGNLGDDGRDGGSVAFTIE